jgi:hypothetical protein
MLGDIVKGIFGDKIGGMFSSLFDTASLFVPQLAMIKTLDMIADTIKEGPEGPYEVTSIVKPARASHRDR